jgi:hypothetical protein
MCESVKQFRRRQAKLLLEEHAQIKGPAELENWNISAQTLIVFMEMNRVCSKPAISKERKVM